jgi:hypothetical protein
MKTILAAGKSVLPVPTITASTGGSIAGDGDTFYFWLKGKNRVGYNQPSTVKSLVVANSGRVTISSTNFNQDEWADFREFIVTCSTTNDFTTSRVIYKHEVYADDQVTLNSNSSVVIDENFVLLGPTVIATPASLPIANIPNGYRIRITSLASIFEYVAGDTTDADEISVLTSGSGRWFLVENNSLTENTFSAEIELIEVTADEYLNVDLATSVGNPAPVKYWIINDSGVALTKGELNLNEYFSSPTIYSNFNIKIIGYLNLSTYALDVTGIDNVGSVISYPDTKISLSKNLPNDSAFVVEVQPDITLSSNIPAGSAISIYPTLSLYQTIDTVEFWDEPVDDLAALAALNSIQYKNGQTRIVKSNNRQYRFDSTSTTTANGDSVIIPSTNPASGRWIASSVIIPDQSITEAKLSSEVVALLEDGIEVTTVTISSPTTYTVDLDTVVKDYFVFNCPTSGSATPTVFNVTKTMANNTGVAIVLELRQLTSPITFDNTILFPGGNTPVLSGANKTDLIVIKLIKDSSGTLKKRGFVAQRDIG